MNSGTKISECIMRNIRKKMKFPIYPKLYIILLNLCKLEKIEKLCIIGYITDDLILTNLPNLKTLKLLIIKNIILDNLPTTFEKIEIEPYKNNFFGKILSRDIDEKFIKVKINDYTDPEEYYNLYNKFLFNITIPHIPFNCNIVIKKPFELTEKYALKTEFI